MWYFERNRVWKVRWLPWQQNDIPYFFVKLSNLLTLRFVHILCALYIPGVAFQDTEKLWPVVLDEIPAQRWGEQACSLCEDPCLTRTGIVIKCDAGLCKTYFHVTCGLAHGFLVDPMQQVKQVMKLRRRRNAYYYRYSLLSP